MNVASRKICSQLVKGSKSAFREIYECYASRIFDLAYKILKNRAQAEEIVQETFLKLWLGRERIDIDRDIWLYVYVIAKRLCLNTLRDDRLVSEADIHPEPASTNDVEGLVFYRELVHELRSSIDNLPEQQKKALSLSRDAGYSHKEIADQMGISQHTVRNHITQALKSLRKSLIKIDYIQFLIIWFLC